MSTETKTEMKAESEKKEKKEKKSKTADEKKPKFKLELTEHFDQDKLAHIVKHEAKYRALVTRWTNPEEDLMAPAREMLKFSKNGEIVNTYMQNGDFGRMFARGGRSLQGLAREIRHSICADYYVDIDMSNAHPTILSFLCGLKRKENKSEDSEPDEDCEDDGIDTKNLDLYIKNRDQYLSDLGCERDAGKQVFLALINGGNKDYNKLIQENKVSKSGAVFLDEFKKEMKKIHQRFAKDDPKGFEAMKKKRIAEGNDFNHEAAFMNTLLCDFENKILMAIYTFYKKPTDAVLCFDGLMLKKEGFDEKTLPQCEKYVEKKLDIKIKLAVKKMTDGFDFTGETIAKHLDLVRENPQHEIDAQDPYMWLDFMREFSNGKVYQSMEELKVALTPKMRKVYAYISAKGGMCVIKNSKDEPFELLKMRDMPDFKIKVMAPNESGVMKTQSKRIEEIAKELMLYLPSYTRVVLKVKNCQPDEFNLWRGFAARKVDTVDKSKFETILRIIFEVWCRKDKNVYAWVMQFLQFIVKNPGEKARLMLLLYGRDDRQGCGKTTPIEFFGRFVLGLMAYYTPSSFTELMEKHNTIKIGKMLTYIAELSAFAEGHKNEMVAQVKTLIDNVGTMDINPKGAPMYKVDDISNYIGSTNALDSWPTNEKSRKETILHVDEFLADPTEENKKFWDSVRSPKNWNQEAGDHFYTYLLTETFTPEDSSFNFRVGQGLKSTFKTQVASMSGRSHIKFISDMPSMLLTTEKKKIQVRGKDGKLEYVEIKDSKGKGTGKYETEQKKTTYIDQIKLIPFHINTKLKISRKNLYKMYCTWASEGKEGTLAESRFKDLITETAKIVKSTRGKEGDMYCIRGVFDEDQLKAYKPVRVGKHADKQTFSSSKDSDSECASKNESDSDSD